MFTKSRLNRSKHCTRHHFLKMNRCRWCWQTSSHLPWDLIMRWSRNRGCHHFLSFIFSVNARFVFGFVVFCLWVNSDIRWQSDYIGLFQILCLGSCRLSIDLKLSLSSLARYVISSQSDMETKSSSRYGFVRIQFQINPYHSLEQHANFIHRQGATDHKAHGSDLRGEKVSPCRPTITMAYVFILSSRFCPSLTGHAVPCMPERSAQPGLRWWWVCK